MDLVELKRLTRHGEGLMLEFKRKARHPEKIARELIAFANTKGGTLLVGVDDDGTIYGSKTVEEDLFSVKAIVDKYCYPKLPYRTQMIWVNAHRAVLAIDVKESKRKPHFLGPIQSEQKKQAFVRVADMSIVASPEMVRILRYMDGNRGVKIIFGDHERNLLQYLDTVSHTTIEQTRQILKVSRRKASQLLVNLVRAGILQIQASEKGDRFILVEDSFY